MATAGSPAQEVSSEFLRRVEHAAAGALRVRERASGTLGDEQKQLQLCQQGQIQLFGGSLGAVATVVPEVSVLELPYLFADEDAFVRARVHEAARRIESVRSAFEARGLVLLGVGYLGWRGISSRSKRIRVPADLKDVVFRAQNSPLHRALWETRTKQVRTFELNELSLGFGAHSFDAFDVPATYVFATGLTGDIKYHTRTNHMPQLAVLVANRDAFLRLPTRLQKEILGLGDWVSLRLTAVHRSAEHTIVNLLGESGVEIIRPDEAELAQWREDLTRFDWRAAKLGGGAGLELVEMLRQRMAGGAAGRPARP